MVRPASKLFAIVLLAAARPAPAWLITETPVTVANSGPNFIIVGPDGNMWFTEYNADRIGVVDSRTGALLHGYITASSPCGPIGLTMAGDGNVWYTCTKSGHGAIGKMDRDGNAVQYPTPSLPAGPIAWGQDGVLYYSRTDGAVGVADLGGTSFASYAVSASIFGLSAGGDGFMWVASPGDTNLWRIRFTGTEAAPTWSAVSTHGELFSPYVISWCQPIGGVYWVSYASGEIVKENSSTSLYVPKSPGALSSPEGVVCTPDGNGWFASVGGNYIGRFDDLTTTYPVPTANALPYQLAVGPDGSIWFTENAGNAIGRLQLHPPGDLTGSGTPSVNAVFMLINYLFAGGPFPTP